MAKKNLDLTGGDAGDELEQDAGDAAGDEGGDEKAGKSRSSRSSSSTRGRPSNRARQSGLESKLAGGLERLAELVAQRDEELGGVLKEDGPKMAKLAATFAVKAGGPVFALVSFMAAALEPLDAFGRTGKIVAARARARRAAAAEQHDEHQDAGDELAGDYRQPGGPHDAARS